MTGSANATPHDVIVIGAGISGIYALYRFSRQGLDVLCLESAAGVGGVWHHNRYPGARVDVESTQYCYMFSKELYEEWIWPERYSAQPDLERYFNHVVDKFDLRKNLRLNSKVIEARWLASERLWRVETDNGESLTCRFLVTAMGNLTAPRQPDFPGLADFEGEWMQTGAWPQREVELKGRRVAVFGTGSSGVQCIPAVAKEARHLTIFQRSPNYSLPARNRPLNPQEIAKIAARLDEYRKEVLHQSGATLFPPPRGPVSHFTEHEREAILEEAWQFGGHAFARIFDKSFTDEETNRIISDFVIRKIKATVDDPEVARMLCPDDHGLGTRRPCVDTHYFETFNRENVSLVDLREDPLVRFTPKGIQTVGAHHDVDLVIFALGFRAFTGALLDANIRNEKGHAVTDHWRPGWRTLLGYMTTGFPNLLMISGPGGITLSANVPVAAEFQVDWLANCLAYMKRHGHEVIEPVEEAQSQWVDHVAQVASTHAAMKNDISNWWIHRDPETGVRVCMTFLGGWPAFMEHCNRVADDDYAGFKFS